MRRLIVILLALSAYSVPAWCDTLRVTPKHSSQLPEMLSKLQPGDSVIFERGVYDLERSLILSDQSDLVLRAEGKVELVLRDLESAVIELRHCERIRIQGLRARHLEPNSEYECEGAVITVRDSQQIAVKDCQLNGCGAAGVYATETRDLVVLNNILFRNTFAAVWLYNSSALVQGNRIHSNAAEVITTGECDVTLVGNQVKNNSGNTFGETEWSRRILRER